MKNIALTLILVATLGVWPTFVLAQGDGVGRSEERKPEIKTALDASAVACIKSAVIKREDALIAGFDVYALALKNARQVRRDALALAWDKTVASERRSAVKSADRAFSESVKTARKAWNETRRSIWSTFTVDRKACNAPSVSAVDTGSPATDASI